MDYCNKLVGENITDHYNSCLEKNPDDPLLAVDWTNKEAAVKRYQAFMSNIDDLRLSVLDFGSGTGELTNYLRYPMREDSLMYSGCDSNPRMVEVATNRYGRHHFFYHLPVGQELEYDYDVILCNGVFTEKTRDYSWIAMMDYVKSTLSMLLKHTQSALIVNFMNFHSLPMTKQRDELFFLKLNQAADLCKFLGVERYTIDASHLPYEFILRMYK